MNRGSGRPTRLGGWLRWKGSGHVLVGISAFLTALAVRAASSATADFPLNDGGLFYAMTIDLGREGWSIPQSVSWNGQDIPFAYPPFGFYLTSWLGSAFDSEVLTVMRIMPTIVSAAGAVVVAAIAFEMMNSRLGSAAAALTYAFSPAAFSWSIAGGGITRAPGIVLGLTCVWLTLRLVARPSWARGAAVAIAAAATALTHPASAVFAGLSGLLVIVALRPPAAIGRTRVLLWSGAAFGASVVLILPWLLSVVSTHGIGVFVGVASNGPDPDVALATLAAGRVTGLGTDPLGLVIAGAAVVHLMRGRLLLPLWLVASAFLGSQYAIIPGSLLIGVLAADTARWALADSPRRRMVGRAGAGVIVIFLALEAVAGATAASAEASHLQALGESRRDAMAWIAANTPQGATVAVLTGDHWSTDPDSEWFAVLAERTSVATVQGQEWLGREVYAVASGRYAELQRCTMSLPCLESWLRENPADYLFIPKGQRHGEDSTSDCCLELRRAIDESEAHRIVLDGAGATVVRLGRP